MSSNTAERGTKRKRKKQDQGGKESKIKVLHVDDSPDFVEIASTYLRKTEDSISVETETRPSDALERLKDEEFDCVISDCTMPGMEMDGIGFRQAVREDRPELPFVFFTGTSASEFPEEAVEDEATGHVRKEIEMRQFSNLATWIKEMVEK
jgi:CheY-like chemotaxis protein